MHGLIASTGPAPIHTPIFLCVPGSEIPPRKKRDSSGYEYFDPPVTSKMFKELKAKVASLTKDVQDLCDQLARLEGEEMKELKASSLLALKKVSQLEEDWKEGGKQRAATNVSQQERNKLYLKTLSCAQVC